MTLTGTLTGPAPRACLVVPGSDARKVDKALSTDVDEIVLDLEDAVAIDAKDAARARVTEVVAGSHAPALAVRVNQVGSAWCHQDVLAVVAAATGAVTLVLPKVDKAADLGFLVRLVDGALEERRQAGGSLPEVRFDALVETAASLRDLDAIASAARRLRALVVGYADLAADLGRDAGGDPTLWDPTRALLVSAARAHGRLVVDGPFLSVAADDAFLADKARARDHGFDGTWVIHPAQVKAATELFSPTDAQVAWAGRVVAALDSSVAAGAGAVAVDGQMVDEAVAVRARSVLTRSGQRGPVAS